MGLHLYILKVADTIIKQTCVVNVFQKAVSKYNHDDEHLIVRTQQVFFHQEPQHLLKIRSKLPGDNIALVELAQNSNRLLPIETFYC